MVGYSVEFVKYYDTKTTDESKIIFRTSDIIMNSFRLDPYGVKGVDFYKTESRMASFEIFDDGTSDFLKEIRTSIKAIGSLNMWEYAVRIKQNEKIIYIGFFVGNSISYNWKTLRVTFNATDSIGLLRGVGDINTTLDAGKYNCFYLLRDIIKDTFDTITKSEGNDLDIDIIADNIISNDGNVSNYKVDLDRDVETTGGDIVNIETFMPIKPVNGFGYYGNFDSGGVSWRRVVPENTQAPDESVKVVLVDYSFETSYVPETEIHEAYYDVMYKLKILSFIIDRELEITNVYAFQDLLGVDGIPEDGTYDDCFDVYVDEYINQGYEEGMAVRAYINEHYFDLICGYDTANLIPGLYFTGQLRDLIILGLNPTNLRLKLYKYNADGEAVPFTEFIDYNGGGGYTGDSMEGTVSFRNIRTIYNGDTEDHVNVHMVDYWYNVAPGFGQNDPYRLQYEFKHVMFNIDKRLVPYDIVTENRDGEISPFSDELVVYRDFYKNLGYPEYDKLSTSFKGSTFELKLDNSDDTEIIPGIYYNGYVDFTNIEIGEDEKDSGVLTKSNISFILAISKINNLYLYSATNGDIKVANKTNNIIGIQYVVPEFDIFDFSRGYILNSGKVISESNINLKNKEIIDYVVSEFYTQLTEKINTSYNVKLKNPGLIQLDGINREISLGDALVVNVGGDEFVMPIVEILITDDGLALQVKGWNI